MVLENRFTKLDELFPMKDNKYNSLISYVKDRPGHDRRYAINSTKITLDYLSSSLIESTI